MNKSIFRFVLVLVSLICASFAYSQPIADIEAPTQQLLKFSSIPGKNLTPTELNLVIENAKKRHEIMIKNIKTPELFIKWLLPKKMTSNFPPQIHSFLEKQIDGLEGNLEIIAAITEDGKNSIQYVLRENENIYYLHFSDEPPTNLKTDMRIRINHCYQIPTTTKTQHVVLSSSDIKILKTVSALPLSFGPQTTLAFLVNFSDKPTDRPFTPDFIKNLVFTDTNNYYYEASYHQTTIVGQTTGWYVVNVPSNLSCDDLPYRLADLADQAATQAGVNLANFKRKVYFFPKTSACIWAGLGYVGGQTTRSWVNGYVNGIWVVGHELGHNVGLGHARSLTCPTSPIDGTCTLNPYGDGTDIMGNINAGHFNAFQKDRLGWLNYQVSPPITTVTQSGSYFIDAYETFNKKPKALKVLKRAGGSDYYYLEFRQGIGFDKALESCGTNCDFTRGIVFHQGNPGNTNSSDLLDMSPGSGSQKVALLPCQSWRDASAPNGGITFTVQSISSQGARVKITYGGLTPTCQRNTPSINVLPVYTKWLASGQKDHFTISVKNNDSEKCEARNVSFELPANTSPITTVLNQGSLKLAPGETKAITLSATSGYSEVPFISSLNLTMKDNAQSKAIEIPLNIGLYR